MGPLCACSFANVSEHIHVLHVAQWISLHLWGAFLVCKPPPQKTPLCTFKSQMAFDLSLSLPAPICLCYSSLLCFGVCLHSHPLLQTHSLYISTDRSKAERREAVKAEGCQRRHLRGPHQCPVDSPQTFHLWPFV